MQKKTYTHTHSVSSSQLPPNRKMQKKKRIWAGYHRTRMGHALMKARVLAHTRVLTHTGWLFEFLSHRCVLLLYEFHLNTNVYKIVAPTLRHTNHNYSSYCICKKEILSL